MTNRKIERQEVIVSYQTNTSIRILDRNLLFSELLKQFFKESDADYSFEVLHSSDELFSLENEPPEILLLELENKPLSGLEILKRVRALKWTTRVIVLSLAFESKYTGFLLYLGANAYQPKSIGLENLTFIINRIRECGYYWNESQWNTIRNQLSSRNPKYHYPALNGITRREHEVLELVCQQMSIAEIADILSLSKKTVEAHKTNLFVKSGVSNTAGLIIFALRFKLIDLQEIVLREN